MIRRIVAAVAAAVLLAAVSGCVGRADFDNGTTFADVERVLGRSDLDVCNVSRDPDGLANQAVDTRTYLIALDCSQVVDDGEHRERSDTKTGDAGTVRVVVDRFDDADHRDGAARQFEGLVRPRGDGAVWTWGPFTIFANGARDDAVMNRITDSLDRAGAE